MSGAIIGVNLAVWFLLELCALCALAYWGAKSGDGRIATTRLGIGASLADAVLWATGLKDEKSKWVAIPEAKAPDGAFVHQRGVSSVRGLYSLHRPEVAVDTRVGPALRCGRRRLLPMWARSPRTRTASR